jgi:hypothetical protein
MIGIFRTTICTLAVALVLTPIVGCKKSEPAAKRQDRQALRVEADKAVAAESRLQRGVKVEATGKPIDIKVGHLVPCVSDWNNDGRKDLIVGQFSEGAIRLYLNQGTDAEPVFNDSSFLQAGGKPIRLDAG